MHCTKSLKKTADDAMKYTQVHTCTSSTKSKTKGLSKDKNLVTLLTISLYLIYKSQNHKIGPNQTDTVY